MCVALKRVDIIYARACEPVLAVVGTGGAFVRAAARHGRACRVRLEEPAPPAAVVVFVEPVNVLFWHADVRRVRSRGRKSLEDLDAMLQERQWSSHLQNPETAARRRRLLGAVVAGQRDGPGRVDAAGAAAAAPSSMGSLSSSVGIICEAAGRFRPITPLWATIERRTIVSKSCLSRAWLMMPSKCMRLTPGWSSVV